MRFWPAWSGPAGRPVQQGRAEARARARARTCKLNQYSRGGSLARWTRVYCAGC